MLPLFESIKRNIEEQRSGKTPIKDFTFKAYDSDHLDKLIILLDDIECPDINILDYMEKNTLVMYGLFIINSTSNIIWNNRRFIDLISILFSNKYDNKYTMLRLFFIKNIDRVNLILAHMIQNNSNEDFLINLYRLIETIWGQVIAEIQELIGIDKWNTISKKDWYITICSILGHSKSYGSPIYLNNLILTTELGDSTKDIINLYYIFFGKEFSVVALENIYPSDEDILIQYMNNIMDNTMPLSIGGIILDNLYIRSENLLKATREIILSLTIPDLVKILRVIDANSTLSHRKSFKTKIISEDDPKIKMALSEIYNM